MELESVGFVGGGRIARVLLERLAGHGPARLVVSDSDASARARLAAGFPTVEATADNRVAAAQEVVFLALHPPALKSALPEIAGVLRADAVVVSLAPVLTINALGALAAGFGRFARMIPNAPSLFGQGYNPVAYAASLPSPARHRLEGLFDLWGAHPEVEEETLEAYAVLTAMGPTYLWFQLQELRQLGMRFGLAGPAVDAALAAMVRGATAALFESGLEPDEVLDTVPVHPLKEREATVRAAYEELLPALWTKLRPARR
jgi:pyrroline-5-carboxylate reductase